MHGCPVGPATWDQAGRPFVKFFKLIGFFQAPPEIAIIALVIKNSPEQMGPRSVLISDVALEAKKL